MKVIIVDDEHLALFKMEKLLQTQTAVHVPWNVIGSYMNPHDALAACRIEVPDVAFLDIELPEMSGMELAEQLLAIHPQMRIVFVTAFQQFAIHAFQVNALDYLLKPVQPARLAVTLKRIAQCLSLKAAGSGTILVPLEQSLLANQTK
ncbi:response regulator [Paenibacillus cellulositrophicus]|uniref:LytR/AlgR family response regulator transcription factor n=1 Tax=Paenibacillus cellulositrophicus TaxID=562959 RepID=UPI002040ADF4|nr:response regulator [Paenibacillus cellulositrophicus]MCM3001445.1 response regulator [Paenibacillus cellulositrophicus]